MVRAGLQNCTHTFGRASGLGELEGQPLGNKAKLPRGPLGKQGPKELVQVVTAWIICKVIGGGGGGGGAEAARLL